MIQDPDLIHYACIAKGPIVLAEVNSKDAALGDVAAKCLEKTPPFHATFTHTVRSMTYAYLVDKPYVCFAIFDDKLENSEGLAYLTSVRDAFARFCKGKNLSKLSSHCFQGELNPVFRQLLGSGLDRMEGIGSPIGQSRIWQCGEMRSNTMTFRLLGECNIGRRNGEKMENEENRGNGIVLSREFPLIMQKNGELLGHQKAKRVWNKQVWVILSLDVIICVILFAVWLWVCNGFKCIDR